MRVLAIIGSYRKEGIIDRAVDEVLASAVAAGAEVEKIHLIDEPIEFCTNCRACTQTAGEGHGECVIDDGMKGLLARIEAADALILGTPVNFGTVTAVTKRFIERLVCFAYWPWGQPGPKPRGGLKPKRGVIIASSAAPSLLARWAFGHFLKLQKDVLKLLGARTVGVLYTGLVAIQPHQELDEGTKQKARELGKKLVA